MTASFIAKHKYAHSLQTISGLVSALILNACATHDAPFIPAPLEIDKPATSRQTPAPNLRQGMQTQVFETPKPPVAKSSSVKTPPQEQTKLEAADISLAFDQIPLPTFIQVVYGSILKKNFNIDPLITQRQDLVTLRTGAPQTPSDVANTAKLLLKSYGIAVQDLGGFLRIVPDNNMGGYQPEIRRGRALPDTPMPMRPVFHLIELQAVRYTDVSQWLRNIFGARIQVMDDNFRNAILISGQPDDVTAALETISILDQPLMKGKNSLRISPVFWSVDELAKKTVDILVNEGYAAGLSSGGINNPISLLPIQSNNTIIVFASDNAVLNHVAQWLKELDKPVVSSTGNGFFTYHVRYVDANDLAKTIQDLLSNAQPTTPAAGTTSTPKKPGRVVVNPNTNSVIFQGASEDYTQWLSLLQELDRPAKSALIEVVVAEVTLSDKNSLGVEWELSKTTGAGGSVIASTLGALGIGNSGLTVKRLGSAGEVKAVLNALASSEKANVLSSPRIVARNGESATITVGQEVPIITSQQSNANTNPGTGGILQTVQYRSTGVILKVKPVIHAGGRIDIEVSQEVSSAKETQTGVNTSPTISNRKVETKLSVKDGSTVMLAGLMSQDNNNTDTGVPLLKDIPAAGYLFKNASAKKAKTELLILITPYVINDDFDADAYTEAFRSQLGGWAKTMPTTSSNKSKPIAETTPAAPISTIETPATSLPLAEPSPEAIAPVNTSVPAMPNKSTIVTDDAILQEIRAKQASDKAAKLAAPKKP